MSQLTQQLADTREYTKLISASLVDVTEKLDTLNEVTNTVGSTIVKNGAQAQEMFDRQTETTQLLEEIRTHQDELSQKADDLGEKLSGIKDNKDDVLEALALAKEKADNLELIFNNAGAQFQQQLDTAHAGYTQDVTAVHEALTAIEEHVEAINYDDEFKALNDTLAENSGKIVEADNDIKARQTELMDKLEHLTQGLSKTYDLLSEIRENGQELSVDLQTAIARASSIELALEAMTDSKPDTYDYKPNFKEALAELHGEEPVEEVVETEDAVAEEQE
jgi:hypothetical protein